MQKIWIKEVIKYFRKHIKKHKISFFILMFSSICAWLIWLIMPIFYKNIIDVATSGIEKQLVLSKLMEIFIGIVLFGLFNWTVRRILEFSIVWLEIKLMGWIYRECFNYVHKHSYRFFSNNFSWSLVKKINRLVDSIEWIIDLMTFDIIKFIISFLFVVVYVTYQNIYLWMIFTTWMFIFASISFLLNRWHYKYRLAAVEEDSVVSWALADTITNNFNISIFGSISREFNKFSDVVWKRQFILWTSWKKSNIIYAILSVISISMELSMIFFSIMLWYKWMISIWIFVLIISYQMILAGQLFSIWHIFRRMNNVLGNASEMIEILSLPHEIKDVDWSTQLQVNKWNIIFSDVSFEYNKWVKVFDKFNLSIQPGERVALVGQSGSWKSSVVKLLFRFYDLNDWKILIDNQDISKVSQVSLRSSIAMVPQDPILFHRSLYENIAYANPDATEQEVMRVSKLAHCHEFVSKFPDGYNTLVWERWVKLSWWERQRIAIARALLSNAKILVLDEATSSLDSESESLIQDAIDNLMDNKTLIVIAHRLSTIMKMDRIIVMWDWEILEQWKHDELIQKDNWVYKKLWDIQSGWFNEANLQEVEAKMFI